MDPLHPCPLELGSAGHVENQGTVGPSAGAPTFLVCMGVGPALGPDSLTCLQEGQNLIILVQEAGWILNSPHCL